MQQAPPLIILYITIRPLAGSLNNHYQFKEGFRQSLFFERLNQTYFCPITAFYTSNDNQHHQHKENAAEAK